MNVALVTGASGFLGRHVCSQLHNEGDQVLSLSRKADAREAGVLRIPEKPSVEDFRRVIDETRPDTIYHLAGTSMSSDLAQLYQTNVILAQTILSAVAATGAKVKVVLIGSAAEYGEPVDPQGIVRETDRCRPVSAYGISKLAQTLHGLAAAGAGLDVTIARLFNPIGPGSGTNTALGSFVHQVTSLRGGPGVLKTGSLDSVRDFIEIGEAARAIVALARLPASRGEIFNISTGSGVSLQTIVDLLLKQAGGNVDHLIETSRRGTSDISRVIGDNSKIAAAGIDINPTNYSAVIQTMLDQASPTI